MVNIFLKIYFVNDDQSLSSSSSGFSASNVSKSALIESANPCKEVKIVLKVVMSSMSDDPLPVGVLKALGGSRRKSPSLKQRGWC